MMRCLLFVVFMVMNISVMAQRVSLTVPSGHAKNIEQIAVSPNGKYIASTSQKTVIIWDVANNKKIHEINLEISLAAVEIRSVSITDKLDKVVVSSNDGLYCYNIQTGKKLFKDGGVTAGAALSKDGEVVYAVDFGGLQMYDAESGQKIKRIDDFANNSAGNCKFYELGNNRLLVLYFFGWSIVNTATGNIELKKFFKDIYAEKLSAYDYDKASNTIVGLRDDQYVVLDVPTANLLKTKKPLYYPLGLCAMGNSQLLAFSHDYKTKSYKIELMQLPSLTVSKTISQPDSEVPETIFYGTKPIVVSGTQKVFYNNNNELFTVNASTGVYEKKFTNRIADFKPFFYHKNLTQRLLADNTLRFATEDNGIRQFDFESYKPIGYVQAMKRIILSADGKLMASIDKKITILNGITGGVVKTIPLPATIDPEIEFFFFNYNNSKLVYTEKLKGVLHVLDIATGVSTKLATLGTLLMQESSSFDGKYFATITSKNNINFLTVYNLESKAIVLNKRLCDPYKDADCPSDISFLNDSYYIITTSLKEAVNIYKADDAAYSSTFNVEHYNQFSVLGGDIKNNIIAIGEVGQFQVGTHNIKLITKEGKLIKTFKSEKNNDFLKVTFSKDGKLMFTPTTQKGVQVWNVATGELLGTYYFVEKTKEYVFISPEGLFDGSPEGMKELYFVRNNKPIPLDKLFEKFYTPELLRRKVNGEKFAPPSINGLFDVPIVAIKYAEVNRNLEVEDDKPTYSNTSGIAEITVNATAPEDKVDEIRLFHNGKAVNLATRGLFVTDADGTDTKKYTINLLPGANNFRAIALNSQRTESEPDEILVNYQSGNAPAPKPGGNTNGTVIDAVDKNATMHLVVVGVNAYKGKINPLGYAVPDATAFKEEIEKDARSVISNVKSYFITDAQADKTGIVNAFTDIKKNAKPQDVFVFYYAGHGYIHPGNKEFYLVSADVEDGNESLLKNGVAAKELQSFAVDIAAQKQVFILDACQSAGAFEQMLKHDGEQQKALAVVSRSTGTHWMAASGSTETAKEFGELGHGAFTYTLLQALKGQAAANKMITVNGLKNFLQVQVPELIKKYGGGAQYPASYGFGNDFPVEIMK
ncbi:MAG TPA: caspase family protein [Niabella sp.]|nr:caspase family protein [Chitinophagaceae bacterium]HRO85397.1 caspase family protein [Niabella sp.]